MQRLPGILTIRELSERWGMKEVTLRGWKFRGYGPPAFNIGVAVVYRLEDIEAWEHDQDQAS